MLTRDLGGPVENPSRTPHDTYWKRISSVHRVCRLGRACSASTEERRDQPHCLSVVFRPIHEILNYIIQYIGKERDS